MSDDFVFYFLYLLFYVFCNLEIDVRRRKLWYLVDYRACFEFREGSRFESINLAVSIFDTVQAHTSVMPELMLQRLLQLCCLQGDERRSEAVIAL